MDALTDSARKIFSGIARNIASNARIDKNRENIEVIRERWRDSKLLFIKEAIGLEDRWYLRKGLYFKGQEIESSDRTLAVWLAPRGTGKSTVGSIADTLWEICDDRDKTHLLASETKETSIFLASSVRHHLTVNDNIKSVYGDFVGNKWKESFFTVSGRKRRLSDKEGTVECIGVNNASTGRHSDRIVCDDLATLQNSRTPVERYHVEDWWKRTLLPMLNSDGEMLVRGTRYFTDDLYGYLYNRYGATVFLIQKALMRDDDPEVKEVIHQNYVEMQGRKYYSICENYFPVKGLIEMKQNDPATFYSQYMNEIRVVEGGLFSGTIRTISEVPKEQWNNFEIWMSLDIATGRKKRDYTALTVGLVDTEEKLVYVPYAVRGMYTNAEQIAGLLYTYIHLCYDHGGYPRNLMFENNGLAWLIMEDVRKILEERGVAINYNPINKQQDKIAFAAFNSIFFTKGRVYILEDLVDLIEELSAFPYGDKDDMVDSLMMTLYQIREYSKVDFYSQSTIGAALSESLSEICGVAL